MTDNQDPIQQQLIGARRKQILDAATEVFSVKGFHRATVRDVAKAAGVADGTIYNYFDNKTALLVGILDRLNESEERPTAFAAGGEQDFKAFFVFYLRHRLAILRENAKVLRAVLPEIIANPELGALYYRQVIEPTVSVGRHFYEGQIARGVMREVDVDLSVRAIAGSVLGLMLLQLIGDPALDERWDDLPEAMAELFIEGLAAR